MDNKIIININEANKSQKFSTDGLFQIEAFKKVTEMLKEHTHSNDIENITDCRFHDTIFINGDRGVGKTAFMLNIEKYYSDINDKIDKQKYLFLDPVDPTLLEHSEKFLSVILARIVEKINSAMHKDNTNIEDENYFRALEKLSKSLSAIKTLPDDLGIEEIASNKSSLKLEQHAHEFFRVVCSIFKVDALVMLIDDVDMAFEKGFDVLEVVRKYLASPFIIPVVAGDMKLYREIVETKFMEKIEFSKDVKYLSAIHSSSKELIGSEEYTKKRNLIDSLVEQYLRKIFPNEYQIQLQDIFSVLEGCQVIIKLDDNLEIPYNKIKIFETRHINLGINQDEFYFQVFSNNTRDFIQYLYSKKDIYRGYFENIDKDGFIDNMNLYKDSFRKTAEFYKFSHNQKKKELSILTDNDYRSFENNEYSLYEAFINKRFLSMKKFHNIEKSVDKYSIKAKGLQAILNHDDGYKNISNYIIDLFVFNDYYSSYQRRNYIYSGNFLESIIYSLSINKQLELIKKKWIDEIHYKIDNYLNDSEDSIEIFHDSEILRDLNDEIYSILYDNTSEDARDNLLSEKFNNIKVDDDSLKKYNLSLENIAYKIPFGSEFLTNKRYKDEGFEDTDEIYESQNKYDLSELSRAIVIWRNVFLNNIELNSISMYEILYKFFTNLEKIKNLEMNELKENKPIFYLRRVVLVFINSIAFFENSNDKVANVNIATNKEFNLDNILSKTSASVQNIKPMFHKKNSLTRALFFHPIISHILFSEGTLKLNDLEFVNQKKSTVDTRKDKETLYKELQKQTKNDYNDGKLIELFKTTHDLLLNDKYTNTQKEYALNRLKLSNLRWARSYSMISEKQKEFSEVKEVYNMVWNDKK